MGRIKIQLTKRTARKLYALYKGVYQSEFDANKALVRDHLPSANKKLRNIIAGYITRLVRQRHDII